MNRQPGKCPPDRRYAVFVGSAETLKKCVCKRNRGWPRRFKPGELFRICFAKSQKVQDSAAKIDPADLGLCLFRPATVIGFAPKPDADASRGPTCSPGALIRGRAGNRRDAKPVEADSVIEHQRAGKA